MSSKAYIKQAINRKVDDFKSNYSNWYIGITSNPDVREGQHGYPEHWTDWDAETEEIAREIEKYFLALGMKGDTGGGSDKYELCYVYIYWYKQTLWEYFLSFFR